MKKIVLLFLVSLTLSVANAQTDSYSKALKKYMEVSGSMQSFKVAIKSILGNFKNMKNGVPDEFWNEMESELSGTSIDELVGHLSPVYKKYLTESDLNEIIAFYSSPIGKKMADSTPGIMTESMQAGQVWGQAVATRVLNKLKEKGY
ncbi:MAG: DUF2059 domain-containing protein [Bacteroidetes bacterium]|nr:DUF2059 domain-containing protein [Bacteroidota bacterium]